MGLGRPGVTDMRRERGFSMVELLVGLVLAMIVATIVMQALAFYENQKRITSGGSDSAINGAIALFQVKREAKMAGFGLTSPTGLLCGLGMNIYYNGTTVMNGSTGATIVPLQITDGASSAPDQIRFARSQSTYGIAPAIVVKNMPNASSIVTTGSSAGIKNNDLFLVGAPDGGKICTLMQATNDAQPTGNGWDLQHNPSAPYNPPNPNSVFTTAPSYVVGDIVIAMGPFALTNYRILCNDNAAPSSTNSCDLVSYDVLTAGATINWANANLQHIASQIVDLQAQYGVAPAGSDTVNQWVDATGAWAAPTGAALKRIKAIRVAVVARSSKYETDPVSPSSLVLWDKGLASERTLSLSAAQQHYRYRVYYQVIPLVNMIWANS